MLATAISVIYIAPSGPKTTSVGLLNPASSGNPDLFMANVNILNNFQESLHEIEINSTLSPIALPKWNKIDGINLKEGEVC